MAPYLLCVFSLTSLLLSVPAVATETPVDATAAYRDAYGPPPMTESVGQCVAAVVFLPGLGESGSPDKLSPIPLFSVHPKEIIDEAARMVVEGYPRTGRMLSLPRVFPRGSELVSLGIREGVAMIEVAAPPGKLHPLAKQALAYTLTQFPEVSTVNLFLEGRESLEGLKPKPGLTEAPPPPRLIDVVSSVHPGEAPTEIDILFDRPIQLDSFALGLADGTTLPGKIYVSMFDMAVIYRPEDPGSLREGLPLRLRWEVTDKTGKGAKGEREVTLRIFRQAS